MLILSLILPLLPALDPSPALVDTPTEPPPGMVLIRGGRTKVGSPVKEIEQLVEENETLRASFGPLTGETPQRTVEVDDFYLMVTEVTGEQFAAYLRATNARPPQQWGNDAIDAARKAYLEEEGLKKKEARDAGLPVPESRPFEPREWWLQNWQGKPWKLPKGGECKPVVWVDYQDARGYARWAGLRLMTEQEFQRAVRGDKDRQYPWGDAWESGKYAATAEIARISDTFTVGSFAEGASEDGVFDLAGNAWEWTASPFAAYEGYKPIKLSVGRGSGKVELDALPGFNPDFRVVVGGSFQNSRFLARATIRRGTERTQQTNGLGFRCAGSPQPGRDMSETIIADLPVELRPQNVEGTVSYAPNMTVALDRWTVGQTSCKVPGYALIEGYDFVMFTPVEELYQSAMKDLREYSLEAHPVVLGFLATNQPLLEPALEAGTYLVAFRGAGETVVPKVEEPKEPKEGEEPAAQEPAQPAAPPIESLIPIDVKKDNYVLIDLTGKPVAAIEAKGADFGRSAAGAIQVIDKTVQVVVPQGDKTKLVPEQQKWLQVQIAIPAKARKVFQGNLELRFAEEILARDWRGR